MTPKPAPVAAQDIDIQWLCTRGRLSACVVRINMQDLNTSGEHREHAAEWFARGNSGEASLEVCSVGLANLYRYLALYAPQESAAIAHNDDLMPDDVQNPKGWMEKLRAIADPESLDPDVISRRGRASIDLEVLVDTLVFACRDAHEMATQAYSVQGASLSVTPSRDRDAQGYNNPNDGPIVQL